MNARFVAVSPAATTLTLAAVLASCGQSPAVRTIPTEGAAPAADGTARGSGFPLRLLHGNEHRESNDALDRRPARHHGLAAGPDGPGARTTR